jgi:hypothetical protein
MRVIIDANYIARAEYDILGFTGENNSRTLTFNGLGVTGANAYYLVTYNENKEIVELPIVDGSVTVPATIVAVNGKTPCQVVARGANNFVIKTNIFWLKIGQSVGDVTPDGKPYIDYNDLLNKPQINGVTLSGNKTSEELGISGGGVGTRVKARLVGDALLGSIVDVHTNQVLGGV